jgi:hypothetical protein
MLSVDFCIRSAPGLNLSKLIFKFVKRDREVRTMRLPNVSRATGHNPIECYADRDHGFRSFGVNPDAAAGLNPLPAPAEFRSVFACTYKFNELLLFPNIEVAFNHKRPALRP